MRGSIFGNLATLALIVAVSCGSGQQGSSSTGKTGPTGPSVTVYQTNADQSLLLAQQPSVSFGSSGTGSTTITINPSVQYQQIDGFGASLTDSSSYLITTN